MNTRKTILAALFAAAFTAPLAVVPVHAQVEAQAPQRAFTQAELDQMLAPIALYPDPLLSQVLMAATYPIEVVEAARWSRANPNLQGDAAVRAVQNQDWDPSVRSLVAFPQILQRMDEQLNWTEALGDAFLAQEPLVMNTVQQLRQRAQNNGNLQSSEQIRVEQQGPTIYIEPASPEYVYVPYYDPLVVYGTWWWPSYRPVAWAPWPGYARPYRSGLSASFWWGRPVSVHRTAFVERRGWRHDVQHRRGVDYRSAEVRQRFAGAGAERRDVQREARRDERGLERRDFRQTNQPSARQFAPTAQTAPAPQVSERQQQRVAQRDGRERGGQDRAERREAQRPEARQAQPPRARPELQAQPRQEQTRPERREAREPREARQPREAQQQVRQQRQEQRAAMPAAQAPQTPRAERAERADRPERGGQRGERGNGRGGDRG